jgi:hypothetical protein
MWFTLMGRNNVLTARDAMSNPSVFSYDIARWFLRTDSVQRRKIGSTAFLSSQGR